MPATVAGIHLGPDTHANRPAADAAGLPIGALYSCTDHSLVYRSDGSSWTTYLAVSGLSNPMTTAGDIIQSSDGSGTPARLALGSQGSVLRSGASAAEWQKNNLAATAAPDADNDVDEGYTVGSRWIDTTADKEYVCLDATSTAAVWTETTGGGSGSGGGSEILDYTEITSSVAVSSAFNASETTGNTTHVVTAGGVSFDGSTVALVEFYAAFARGDTGGSTLRLYLFDGSTSLGVIAYLASNVHATVRASRRLTPSSGDHTYSIRANVSSGTGNVAAGAGGQGNLVPAFVRIASDPAA